VTRSCNFHGSHVEIITGLCLKQNNAPLPKLGRVAVHIHIEHTNKTSTFLLTPMSDTLFDLSQYQSQANMSESPDLRDATGADPAWEQPDLDPDLGTNSQEPDGDALNQWRSGAEFILTLPSGQTIEVTFVPCLVGKRRMHEFSFTGSLRPTGFKSHFVLAIESEKFPHPRDYAQAYAEEMVARFEAQQQRSGKKRSYTDEGARAPQEVFGADDDSLIEPAMPSDKTDALNHTPVEVVEELSLEEEADRQRLELTVERGFYHSGKALTQLRDRRLYRSTHQKFEDYCQERFGMKRIYAHYLIKAAIVFDNLSSSCSQFVNILPTSESQCRPLIKLEPDEQHQVWSEAVEMAGGKAPSARIVKDAVLRHQAVVDGPKQKHASPLEFAQGDVVEIKALKRSPLYPFNGMWAIIQHVGSFSYTVRISIARDTQQCKPEELTLIDDEYAADIKAVGQRIATLIQFELEPVEYAILELLQRSTCFTPRQLLYLERMEADYGESN